VQILCLQGDKCKSYAKLIEATNGTSVLINQYFCVYDYSYNKKDLFVQIQSLVEFESRVTTQLVMVLKVSLHLFF